VAGRAIALVLGEAGATVYVTGRSVRGRSSAPGRSGTMEETAEAVAERGGLAIPVRCDHTSETDVARAFARVRAEQDRLDLLVNNVWGGYEQRPGQSEVPFFEVPFWEQPLWRWDAMFDAGVRAHFLASRRAHRFHPSTGS
jgi:NAD(P)-dependent dehydrogenase (short-subunit alcohol dehydrogenase family)